MDSEDCKSLIEQMNCGQRCSLRGLISASKDQKRDVYKESVQKTKTAITNGKNLRSTLGQLFNKDMSHQKTTDEAGPSQTGISPSCTTSQSHKIKNKGKYPTKGPIKRKVKEYRLRVVGLTKMCSKTPVGAMRDSKMKNVWVRENSFAEEVARKICETFNWNYDTSTVQYMYANGRYLHKANLEDVENADTWDSEAVRALMGCGCLYVVKGVQEKENELNTCDSDEEDAVQKINADLKPSNVKVCIATFQHAHA